MGIVTPSRLHVVDTPQNLIPPVFLLKNATNGRAYRSVLEPFVPVLDGIRVDEPGFQANECEPLLTNTGVTLLRVMVCDIRLREVLYARMVSLKAREF